MWWMKPGNAFKSYLQTTQCKSTSEVSSSGVPEWLKIFGAGSESVIQAFDKAQDIIPNIFYPLPAPVSIQVGGYTSTVIAKQGDSSRLLSVYAQSISGPHIGDTGGSAGIKLNIGSLSLGGNTSIDNSGNLGVGFSVKFGDTSVDIGAHVNIIQAKAGITVSQVTDGMPGESFTNYAKVEISALPIMMMAVGPNIGSNTLYQYSQSAPNF